jgi:hypothetical protein
MLKRFEKSHGACAVYRRVDALIAEANRRNKLNRELYNKCVPQHVYEEYERRVHFYCEVEVALRRTPALSAEGMVVLMNHLRDLVVDCDLEAGEFAAIDQSVKNLLAGMCRQSLQTAA